MKERANNRGHNHRIMKRIKTEKEAAMAQDQQASVRRLKPKIRLNDIRASLLLLQDESQGFEGMLAGWDIKNEDDQEESYANIQVGLMINKKVEPKILEKDIFKHHASVLLKRRYITQRLVQNSTQIVREDMVKKEQPVIKMVKEGPTPRKKSAVKSLYIKKVNLVVKVKEQNNSSSINRESTKVKPLLFSSQENTKRQYKLPKLQRLSLDRQSLVAHSKKINFPNQSLLRDQLSQLNKLLSTECVSIRQKLMS